MISMAEILVAARAVTIHDKPIFGKSGESLSVYIDCRNICGSGRCFTAAVQTVVKQLPPLTKYLVGGVALGGLMLSPAIAYGMQRGHVAIRPEPKAHGRGQQIEGGKVDGRRVIVIEDAVTTGGSLLGAIQSLRAAGAIVDQALCLVVHRPREVSQRFADCGVSLDILAKPIDVYQVMYDHHRAGTRLLTPGEIKKLREWADVP